MTTTKDLANRRCDYCRKWAKDDKPLKKCSTCRSQCYCDASCQKSDWLTHKNVCRPIVPDISCDKILAELRNSLILSDWAVFICGTKLLEFANSRASNRSKLGKSGACALLLDILKTDRDSLVVVVCFLSIGALTGNADNRARLMETSAGELVLKVMSSRLENSEVIQSGCRIISRLASMNSDNGSILGIAGACDMAVLLIAEASINTYGNQSIFVFDEICSLIRDLAYNDNNRIKLGQMQICELLITLMKTPFFADNTTAESHKIFCGTIFNLSFNNALNGTVLGKAGACEVIIAGANSFPPEPTTAALLVSAMFVLLECDHDNAKRFVDLNCLSIMELMVDNARLPKIARETANNIAQQLKLTVAEIEIMNYVAMSQFPITEAAVFKAGDRVLLTGMKTVAYNNLEAEIVSYGKDLKYVVKCMIEGKEKTFKVHVDKVIGCLSSLPTTKVEDSLLTDKEDSSLPLFARRKWSPDINDKEYEIMLLNVISFINNELEEESKVISSRLVSHLDKPAVQITPLCLQALLNMLDMMVKHLGISNKKILCESLAFDLARWMTIEQPGMLEVLVSDTPWSPNQTVIW